MHYADRIHQQIQALGNVPEPSVAAIAHSEKLYHHLQKQLSEHPLLFCDVMQQLLHAPGLGYYSAGAKKIGAEGDFITAPEISPFFGYALAQQCAEVLAETGGSILEFGAGLGTLARDILLQLETDNCSPETYYIVEISADLRQRQEQLFQQTAPHLLSKVVWLDKLPTDGFKGIILANEVLDAMPVHLFEQSSDGIKELQVNCDTSVRKRAQTDEPLLQEHKAIEQTGKDDWSFEFADELSPALKDWSHREEIKALDFPEGYRSEVNLAMEGWIDALSDCLQQGLILLIDYGFPRHEYYLRDRGSGTLICHYRHHSHEQFFYLPGLQDITAHVDFTAVAEAAVNADLSVTGYTNQASFLCSCGILHMAEETADGDLQSQMHISQQIRKLIMPEEMGEIFKVIALSRELSGKLCTNLKGFTLSDRRHSL